MMVETDKYLVVLLYPQKWVLEAVELVDVVKMPLVLQVLVELEV
tara:strand:+ start:283 stop:414 length:132 start_codon:yes stop_codon:yes gene_type:complete